MKDSLQYEKLLTYEFTDPYKLDKEGLIANPLLKLSSDSEISDN